MRVHQRATRPILEARYARRSSNSRAATRPTSSHSRYVRKGIHSNSAQGVLELRRYGTFLDCASLQSPASASHYIMSNNWETGICGCFDVKDCGIGCCCKLYCVRPAPQIDP